MIATITLVLVRRSYGLKFVAISELLEPSGGDRLRVDDDRICVVGQPGIPERIEDGLDGFDRQRKGHDGRVVPAAHLVGNDGIDPLVIERPDDGVVFAAGNRNLDESYAEAVGRRGQIASDRQPLNGPIPSGRHVRGPARP